MADQTRADIIKGHPFGNGLDDVCTSFHSICTVKNISPVEHLGKEDLQELVLDLLSRLRNHLAAARLVRSTAMSAARTATTRLDPAQNASMQVIWPPKFSWVACRCCSTPRLSCKRPAFPFIRACVAPPSLSQ
ncbi:hypothetical protein G6O67_008519 [Ophiocordyceps sinensis]|uniref:Uncharacterized protein n=1 Tax=Ophiocordyceps sinensis TaxID=72228 RepID=A0A8H4LSI7_9HYPO|nr:hypothetical protein G6O67_008519 [Ophiocordyceps sinensis]